MSKLKEFSKNDGYFYWMFLMDVSFGCTSSHSGTSRTENI